MSQIQEQRITFTFLPQVSAEHYEHWQHYQTVTQRVQGTKCVDISVIETTATPETLYLLEVKDFRKIDFPPKPCNLTGLAQTVVAKAQDTITGLSDAATNASNPSEQSFARIATSVKQKRIVLHLEPHTGALIALFPTNFAVGVYQKLKQLARHIDPKPLVLDCSTTKSNIVPWTAT